MVTLLYTVIFLLFSAVFSKRLHLINIYKHDLLYKCVYMHMFNEQDHVKATRVTNFLGKTCNFLSFIYFQTHNSSFEVMILYQYPMPTVFLIIN